jgi:chromatin remodeling complex protein RSC6
VSNGQEKVRQETDDDLKAVFGGRSTVNMFEMTKLVSKHLK